MGIAGQAPATSESGRAVTASPHGSIPAAHAHTPAGYEPDVLDGPVRSYLDLATQSIERSKALEKKVKEVLVSLQEYKWGADQLDEAERVVAMCEKLSRTDLNLVKAIDGLSRLRSFVAGGPDSRPDLSGQSEGDLFKQLRVDLDTLGYEIVPKAKDVTP